MSQTASTCAGRFSLQLPLPIEQGIDPNVFNSVELRWMDLKGKHVDEVWQSYVDQLRTEQGVSSLGSRVLKNYALDGRHAVFYRYAPTPDSSHTLETWTPYGDKVLKTQFDTRKDELAAAEELTLNVLHHFVPSSANGPAPGAGFCVQGGTIQLAPDQGEQMKSTWGLPLDYTLELSSAVVTAPSTITLLEDTRKAVLQSAVTPGSHLTVTRADHRTVLGMEGQETLQHYHNDPDPANFYNADFYFAGVADKGSKPGWHLNLNAHDNAGNKVDEAVFVATWDAILNNLSMRLKD